MPNGLEARYRTLGQLRTELKGRLGFVAQGPASGSNNATFDSFLGEAHDFVYSELHPSPERKRCIITLEPGSTLYDWHNDTEDEDIDPGTVEAVTLKRSANERIPMRQGIAEVDRSFSTRTYPVKYDTLNGQCEVWPEPDQAYEMVVEYLAPQPRFVQDADRPGVPDRLLFLYALAKAKAHYRHPDASAALESFNVMMRKAKVRQKENRRFVVNDPLQSPDTVFESGGEFKFVVR